MPLGSSGIGDPSAFPNPAVLDIGRTQRNHVAFGRGIHHCLGSLLAQLEGKIAFTALLDRFSSIRLSAEPKYRNQIVLRGLEELWVDVAPRKPRDRAGDQAGCRTGGRIGDQSGEQSGDRGLSRLS